MCLAQGENRIFVYAKTKAQISFAVTAKLISAFVFATRIVQFLFYLNPKLQASSSFLSLYRPICVGPGRKPRRPVFSRRGSNVPCSRRQPPQYFRLKSPSLYHKATMLPINMSRIVRKLDFCLGENKGADQLRGNREADQRLCFRYTDSTISLLLKSEISSF